MSKYINSEEFNNYKFENAVIQYGNVCGELCQIPLRKFIKRLPSIDIVLCMDCKHRFSVYCFLNKEYGVITRDCDFCSKGERKETNE